MNQQLLYGKIENVRNRVKNNNCSKMRRCDSIILSRKISTTVEVENFFRSNSTFSFMKAFISLKKGAKNREIIICRCHQNFRLLSNLCHFKILFAKIQKLFLANGRLSESVKKSEKFGSGGVVRKSGSASSKKNQKNSKN